MRLLQLIEYASLVLTLTFAPVDAQPKADSGIKLPVVAPKSVPDGMPTKLNHGARYVIRAKTKCDIETFPEGLVEIEEKQGPRDWTAIFAGGTGDYEDRHFDETYIYSLKAVGTGTVKVVIIPVGYKDKSEWVRASIEANVAPKPPPKPEPDVTPDPKPKPEPVVVKSFRVIWVYESGAGAANANATTVMNAKDVRDYLNVNCTRDDDWAGWRQWDKDQKVESDFQVFKDLWAAVQPKLTAIPCVVLEVNGKVNIEPFPKSPADAVALFRKFKEGK